MSRYVERLSGHHDRNAFTCGQPDLDKWFREVARQADHRHGSARVFVLVDDELARGTVPIGFYALVAHAVAFEDAPTPLRKGFSPRLPIGAVLLGQLAVAESHQRNRLGEALLADVVRQAIAADERVAMPLLVVDAADDNVVGWYERYGFHLFHHDPRRLALRLADARKTFGVSAK